jgi:aryl-alcohol dehydrogenase-like predicted oxidoreductase
LLKHNLSNIGFGCVKLSSFTSERKAIEHLTFVYDHGVRWFDTAPLYGNGYSERILGGFIKKLSKNQRAELKVVTKFGLGPDRLSFLPIDLALKLNKLKKITTRNNTLQLNQENHSIVTPRVLEFEKIQKQLDNSLNNLGLEQLHGYLGHELLPDFLDEKTTKYLYDSKKNGKIYNLGIGVNSKSILSISDLNKLNEWEILQYEGEGESISTIMEQYPNKIHVHHSIFGNSRIQKNSTGFNNIQQHLINFPQSQIIFSSNSKSHILDNLKSNQGYDN